MRKYLLDKKEDIRSLVVKNRLIKFPETVNFMVSIIGPRRAGKTYSMYDLLLNKNRLADEEFLFINFEDEIIQQFERKEISRSISYHEEIYGKEPNYIFLDEIQGLSSWERWVYTLYEKKRYKIFLTGSSSKLISKEIATQLRGRSVTVKVFPLSFKEFVSSKEFELKDFYSTREEDKLRNILRDYLKNGGFPDVAFGNIDPGIFFREYVDLVVFKDIVERYGIRNTFVIKLLINNILSSFSKNFSINKIYRILKGRNIGSSRKTLYLYSSLLKDVMFAFFLRKFSFSLRESMLSIPKVYVNDTGMVNNFLLLNFEENIGRSMENCVFIELLREMNEKPAVEIYYWRDYQQREVDFILKEGRDIKQLVQVTYASGRDEIDGREIKSLLKAGDELKCKNLLIITWDYEDKIEMNNRMIKCIPLWKWLL